MLVLFETPAGYALFKVNDESKLASPDDLQEQFSTAEGAAKVIKLKAFSKFESTVEVRLLGRISRFRLCALYQ